MLPVLADENFNQRILRGLKLRISKLNLIVAQSAGLCGASDPTLLAWAAEQGRVVLSHDRQTLPRYAYLRIRSRQPMPGVIVISDTTPVGEAVELLEIYLQCATVEEFQDLVLFLP